MRGCEADDLVGSFLRVRDAEEAIILSTARDYLQLVTEAVSLFARRGKEGSTLPKILYWKRLGSGLASLWTIAH